MSREEIQAVADRANLGCVHFQFNVSRNTGQAFEVGYVFCGGRDELFCKRQPRTQATAFYLCNEFRRLTS
jgi:hypothetical protein